MSDRPKFGPNDDSSQISDAQAEKILRDQGVYRDPRDGGIVRNIGMPNRTIERNWGCWNCTMWDNGAHAETRFAQTEASDRARFLQNAIAAGMPALWRRYRQAAPHERAVLDKAMARRLTLPQAFAELGMSKRAAIGPPHMGICGLGGSGIDPTSGLEIEAVLTAAGASCDRWIGRIKPEGPLSDSVEEAYERLGEKPPGK